MRRLKTSCNKIILIDDGIYNLVQQYKWRCVGAGYVSRNIVLKSGKQKTLYLHRYIMNAGKDQYVDHINGDKLDNRKINLRFCTPQQNHFNRPKSKGKFTSKYKGVSYAKNMKKWRARIRIDRKETLLGYFTSEFEAFKAYKKASINYHKEFSRLT